VVAVIEAMKVFNEIRAERAGTVEAILVAGGEEVDAGQLLMRIE
jgi:acetyl-CoA carboxylase biotin carboxyl carrier protein